MGRCTTFHTAFEDPTTPEDAPPRDSVEVTLAAVELIAVENGKKKSAWHMPLGKKIGCKLLLAALLRRKFWFIT